MKKNYKLFTLVFGTALVFAGLASCKANSDDDPTMYTVTVSSSIEHGKVSVDKTSAEAGESIKLTATSDEGYQLESYIVKDAGENSIAVTDGTFTMPEGNVTVSATFSPLPPETASYIVKHLFQKTDASGYEQSESYPDETKSGKIGRETQAQAKTVTGFTAQSFTQATISKSGTTVEIKYDRNIYTVTFNPNGGSEVASQTVPYEATATEPAVPIKESSAIKSYTFAGWYSDSGLTTSFSFDTAITADIRLYAKWTEEIIQQAGSISYATTEVSKTTDNAAFTNELTIVGDGTVTYASSNEEVAIVNAMTGEVTFVGGGWATITATVADSANYTYAVKTASYTIKVIGLKGFVKVRGGTFDGTSTLTPESKVFISGRSLTIGDLYVCDHEVTQKEYSAYMINYGDAVSNDSYKWTDTYGKGDNYPAYFVNWYEAVIYCNLRSMAEGLTPAYYLTAGGAKKTDVLVWIVILNGKSNIEIKNGKYYYNATAKSSVLDYKGTDDTYGRIQCDFTANGYRLPTEAEWEYIARGGSDWKEYTYSGSNIIDDVAWWKGNSEKKTHEVKTKAANSLGIYDMSGNVWEQCFDWHSSSINAGTPASGAASGSSRVMRGASWSNVASDCTVFFQEGFPYERRINDIGFRVVRNAQ